MLESKLEEGVQIDQVLYNYENLKSDRMRSYNEKSQIVFIQSLIPYINYKTESLNNLLVNKQQGDSMALETGL